MVYNKGSGTATVEPAGELDASQAIAEAELIMKEESDANEARDEDTD